MIYSIISAISLSIAILCLLFLNINLMKKIKILNDKLNTAISCDLESLYFDLKQKNEEDSQTSYVKSQVVQPFEYIVPAKMISREKLVEVVEEMIAPQLLGTKDLILFSEPKFKSLKEIKLNCYFADYEKYYFEIEFLKDNTNQEINIRFKFPNFGGIMIVSQKFGYIFMNDIVVPILNILVAVEKQEGKENGN